MPFSARIGFRVVFTGGATKWYDLTGAEVDAIYDTFASDGSSPSWISTAYSASPVQHTVGVVGDDDNIYMVPLFANSNIVVIYASNNTAVSKSFGVSGLIGTAKYFTACLAPNGKIYCPPFDMNKALIIDPATETSVLTDWGITFSGTGQYNNAVLGPDDKIYCLGKNLLVIDPVANTAAINGIVASSATTFRWRGGVRSTVNDKLYFAPYNVTSYLIIDTAANTAVQTNFGQTFANQAHVGIVNAPNGKLYSPGFFAQGGATRYWSIVDPAANTYTRFGVTASDATRVGGITLAADGNIYCCPFDQGAVTARYGIFNPVANTFTLSNFGATLTQGAGWISCIPNKNGKIFSFPQLSNSHMLTLTVSGTGLSNSEYSQTIKTAFQGVPGL